MLREPGPHDDRTFLVVRTRSVLACFLHWILFGSVVVLVLTGLYIGNPQFYYGQGEAVDAFAMANIRTLHFWAATGLIVAVLLRFYLAFTDSCHHDIAQFLPTPWNVVNALKLMRFFTTGGSQHSHFRFVNPLGGIGIFLMSACIAVMIATGFMLFLPAEYSGSVVSRVLSTVTLWLGGQQQVRLLHHMVMYGLIFVVVIHVYMQIWKNVMFSESDISSIVGGYKLFPIDEIRHFADRYGLRTGDHLPTEQEMRSASTPMGDAPELADPREKT